MKNLPYSLLTTSCIGKTQQQTNMAEQLPIITKSHAVDTTGKPASSLLGRGLAAIQLNKAIISTVNWTEVIQKAIAKNINIENLDKELAEIGLSFFHLINSKPTLLAVCGNRQKP